MAEGRVGMGRNGANRLHGDAGAVVVEAALIMPVLLTLVMGVFEGSGIVRDWLATSNAASAGARALSVAGNEPMADYSALLVIKRELVAVPPAAVQRIVIFKPSIQANGLPSASPRCTSSGSTSGVCNVYTATDLGLIPSVPITAYFGRCITPPLSGRDCYWAPDTRKVAVSGAGGPPDYLGVYIQVRYTHVTKLFGSTKDVSQTFVTKLEPQELT